MPVLNPFMYEQPCSEMMPIPFSNVSRLAVVAHRTNITLIMKVKNAAIAKANAAFCQRV